MNGLEENYQNLAIAIIRQAAKDWRSAAKRLIKKPNNKDAKAMKEETERFFHSGWCYELGGVEGDVILGRLKRELEEELHG